LLDNYLTMSPGANKPKMLDCRAEKPRDSEDIAPLDRVLKSLGDPVRLSIVRQLLRAAEGELACGCFDYDVTKQTFSHHMAILDEVGLIHGRPDGTKRMISLRLDHIKQHYPGLLDLVRSAP
jgi:DNA-binding transcriptional ArsR family regulator